MLRPSQTLLKQMPALNKFIIHPPLPMNPRQSKQFLNLLTTSFRQTLEKEHGAPTESALRAGAERAGKSNGQPGARHNLERDLSQRPAEQHMHSLLTNPLFSMLPPAPGKATDRKDPMEVFDRAVANGMMNTRWAYACLLAKKNDVRQSDVLSVRDGMKESGAGLRVLKWLVSSGTANNNDFLRDRKLADILIRFMVAEGLDDVVWKWIERSLNSYHAALALPPKEQKAARVESVQLLITLLRAEFYGPVSFDRAYASLSRASEYLRGLSVTTGKVRGVLGPCASFLFHETVSPYPRPAASAVAYSTFTQLAQTVLSKRIDCVAAFLKLVHPVHPDARPALAYLKLLDAQQTSGGAGEQVWHDDATTIDMGLKAAEFMLQHDQLQDAQWIMKFLQEHYPGPLGLTESGQSKQEKADRAMERAREEAASLRLLQSLSVA